MTGRGRQQTKIKMLLFDGSLPKAVVDLLFSFGEEKYLMVRDQKYYEGSEKDVVLYIGKPSKNKM